MTISCIYHIYYHSTTDNAQTFQLLPSPCRFLHITVIKVWFICYIKVLVCVHIYLSNCPTIKMFYQINLKCTGLCVVLHWQTHWDIEAEAFFGSVLRKRLSVAFVGSVRRKHSSEAYVGSVRRKRSSEAFVGSVLRKRSTEPFAGTVRRNCSSEAFAGSIRRKCSSEA